MNRPLRLLLIWLGCLHLVAGSFGLAQIVAWTTMAIRYSMVEGLIGGLEQTFDGSSPCHLCRAITRAKQAAPSGPEAPAPASRPFDFLLRDAWLTPDEIVRAPAGPPRQLMPRPDNPHFLAGCGRSAPLPPPPRRLA